MKICIQAIFQPPESKTMIYVLLLSAFLGFYSEPIKAETTALDFNRSVIAGPIGREEREIHNLINDYRNRNGLDNLKWDDDLAYLASQYSEQMAEEKFFSHYDRKGNSVSERAKKLKITNWTLIGENLFTCRGYSKFTRFAFDSWLDSPGHRKNILEEEFTHTGIGIAKTRDGRVYVTQVFIER
jgi:uncharacterized protein YkwD